MGYQLYTKENLAWRRRQGGKLATRLYENGFQEFETRTRIVVAVATLGIYPLLLAVAYAVAYASHFLTLPIEVLCQPARLVVLVPARVTMASFLSLVAMLLFYLGASSVGRGGGG